MSTKSLHRISPVKLAGLGAVAATALGVASPALAATSGGAPMTPAAVQVKSAPFTMGFSDLTVKPGQKLTISGLAYARAGKNLTIMSDALASGRSVQTKGCAGIGFTVLHDDRAGNAVLPAGAYTPPQRK